jgi:hypothetical protein
MKLMLRVSSESKYSFSIGWSSNTLLKKWM